MQSISRQGSNLRRVVSDHPETATRHDYDDSDDDELHLSWSEGPPPGPGHGEAIRSSDSLRNVSEAADIEGGTSPRRAWPNDLVGFDGPDDQANPKNWPRSRKDRTTVLLGMTTFCSTLGSSIFSAGTNYISQEFGVSTEVVTLGTSLFVLGFFLGPPLFGPLSELAGRRRTVYIPVFIYACFTAATATATNLQTIFLTRFFGGVFASAPVTTVGGALSDMYDQKTRGSAVVLYSLAVVGGPTLGPIIGGAVAQSYLGWRWTMYLTLIITGFMLCIGIIFVPETYAPVILTRKATALRLETKRFALHSKQEMTDRSLISFLETQLVTPVQMFFTETMVLFVCIYSSFTYGILYLLFAAVPIIFEEGRGWNTLVGALPFLGVLIGTLLGALINFGYSVTIFARKFDQGGGQVAPEARLPPMMLGSITLPIGFFILGWTSFPSVFWLPSIVGLAFIGMSFLLIFQAGLNYLIDSHQARAASVVAALTFTRSLFAAALPLVAQPLFHNLGVQWACTLLGCLSVVFAGVPFLFYRFGSRLRNRTEAKQALRTKSG